MELQRVNGNSYILHAFIEWLRYQQLDETSIHKAPCDPKPYVATHGIYTDPYP